MRVARLACAAFAVALVGCGGSSHERHAAATHPTPATTAAAPPAPPPPPPTTTTVPQPPPAPPSPVLPSVPMSWDSAGAFVWHPTAVDPEVLGRELRANGFGWAAVFVNDGRTATPVDPAWIDKFRRASGLPLGGWGALRADPAHEAGLVHRLVGRYGLAFYVADAESEYGYTGPSGPSGARYARSGAFTGEFRKLEPTIPAAVASYCRPDQHDLDWHAWSSAGFDFLPEAYVNELGAAAAGPAACVTGAAKWFAADRVHPIVGMYAGRLGLGNAATYGRLLGEAGTTGFSVYLAEQGMTEAKWAAFGKAITALGIAKRPA